VVYQNIQLKRTILTCITLLGMLLYILDASIYGTARVIDGDTLHINDIKIRLYGIDAIEKNQQCTTDGKKWQCGLAAKNKLTELVDGNKVYCWSINKDRYKRHVSICYNHKFQDINAGMVRSGYAVAYTKYSTLYLGLETEAKQEKRGIWSGTFTMPEVYRITH
jgi:endonuclease YncB( thermonuclease family)